MEKAEHENDFPPALGKKAAERQRQREDVYALSGVSTLWERKPQPGSGTNTQLEPAVRSLPAGSRTRMGCLSESLINIVFDSWRAIYRLFRSFHGQGEENDVSGKCMKTSRLPLR